MLKFSSRGVAGLNHINVTICTHSFSNIPSKQSIKSASILHQTLLNKNPPCENVFHARYLSTNLKNHQHYKFNRHSFSTSRKLNMNKEWTHILNKAEKLVGYPTSFLNLRYLVSDEVAHFVVLLRKLMLTKHPLIKMARQLIISNETDSNRTLPMNGLFILLISKAAGLPMKNANFMENDISDGIHNSQRRLAEIAEMIYMGSLIHKGCFLQVHFTIIIHLKIQMFSYS